MSTIEEIIPRINELAHKKKTVGLTEKEAKEQQILRRQYIDAFKRNVKATLDNVDIKEEDGTIIHLKDRYENKKGN